MVNRQNSGELTTGQMLDKLGLQDIAVNQDGYKVAYDRKGNLLMWGKHEEKPLDKEGNEFCIYLPWINKDRWEINE